MKHLRYLLVVFVSCYGLISTVSGQSIRIALVQSSFENTLENTLEIDPGADDK